MAEEEILEDSHGKNEKSGFEKAMQKAKEGISTAAESLGSQIKENLNTGTDSTEENKKYGISTIALGITAFGCLMLGSITPLVILVIYAGVFAKDSLLIKMVMTALITAVIFACIDISWSVLMGAKFFLAGISFLYNTFDFLDSIVGFAINAARIIVGFAGILAARNGRCLKLPYIEKVL